MNISSLIVNVRPELLPGLDAALLELTGVTVHAQTPQGKLIVVVESDDDATASETFTRISAMPGVMSVALVYHHLEPDSELEALHGTDPT